MPRLLAALAALLLAAPALAQDQKKPAETKPAEAKPADTKPPDTKPADAPDLDPKTRAAIQREVERAKEDIRNEVRAEIQGAQSAAEFLGTVAEGPKLEFFTLDGYYRVRGEAMLNLSVTKGHDASGYYLFPVPLQNPSSRGTLQTANMRLRLEPTLNVSEHVRVKAQVDVLDNYVLGSSTTNLYDDPGSPYPVPFYGTNKVPLKNDPRADRPLISPKRVWGEVQTPVGLLSFGRMPSEWGLGILTNAGAGVDDDFGDTVDRIQFALPPVGTPIGRLTFVPILDFDYEGVLYEDTRFAGTGQGQPFDSDQNDDGRTYGIKVARLDTADEIRRKHERNEASINFGVYYNYRQQRWIYPSWDGRGLPPPSGTGVYDPGGTTAGTYGDTPTAVHRSAYANITDLWIRWLGPRLRVEAEGVWIYGHVGNPSIDPTVPQPEVLLRQWGGTLLVDYKVLPNKLNVGGEIGVASGDDAPGFGNVPGRVVASGQGLAGEGGPTPYGSVEGAQWRSGTDDSIRNYRYNPAYRVDLVLWRHILGQVTDAIYVKPTVRWDILPGLRFDGAVVYSRAMYSQSTPSARTDPSTGALVDKGDPNLGIELDTTLSYTTGDGFQGFFSWGVLQPLGGLRTLDPTSGVTATMSRANYFELGLVAKF